MLRRDSGTCVLWTHPDQENRFHVRKFLCIRALQNIIYINVPGQSIIEKKVKTSKHRDVFQFSWTLLYEFSELYIH